MRPWVCFPYIWKKGTEKKSTINHIAIGDSSYSLLDTHASRSVLWIWHYLSVCLYVHLQPKIAESGYQFFVIAHLTLVGQCPMKSLLSVSARPSVLPSVSLSIHLSPNFLKRRSLIFSVIAYDDCWPWYLVTDKANFF